MAFCEDLFIVFIVASANGFWTLSGKKRSEFTSMDYCMNLTAGFRVYFEFQI